MTENTVTVRADRAQFRHDGEQYERGDVLEVPQRTFDRHQFSLRRAEDGGSDGDGLPDPGDLTVDEIESLAEDLDANDLIILREVETEGKNRSTALDAINEHIDEPEG
jgi:hypothetical protein